jgi:hypothetical protein
MTIKNLTPHPITICNDAGEVIRTFQPEGLVRLKASTVNVGKIDGVNVTKTVFGEPEGLPEADVIFPYCDNCHSCNPTNCKNGNGNVTEIGTYFIVSQLVKSALPERKDLLVPAEVIRDDKGQIIGCKSLGL